LSVLFTAFLVVRSGESPFGFAPERAVVGLEARAAGDRYWVIQLMILSALSVAKLVVNLFFARRENLGGDPTPKSGDSGRDVEFGPDPDCPERELAGVFCWRPTSWRIRTETTW
jgi:hypothetical protein